MTGGTSSIVCSCLQLLSYQYFHSTCQCLLFLICLCYFCFCFVLVSINMDIFECGVCLWPHHLLIWWGDQCATQTKLSQGDSDLQTTINKMKEASKHSLPSLQAKEQGGIHISWSPDLMDVTLRMLKAYKDGKNMPEIPQ